MSGGQGRLIHSPGVLRRVNAGFAADGDFRSWRGRARRTAFGEDAVALRVGVGAETEEDFACVAHGGRAQ